MAIPMPWYEDVLTPPEDVPSLDSESFAPTLDSSDQSSHGVAPSLEDVLTPLEEIPSLDSRSFAPALSSSDRSSYYRDSVAYSDVTAETASIAEVQIDVECFTPVEHSLYGSRGPSQSGVQVETVSPSPVFTPHALPGLLVGSALDVASKVFTPDRMMTPKSHLLVETVHVPLQPTPPELPTPHVSNDEAVMSNGDLTLYSTTPVSKSTHPRLQLVRPPPQTLPSPTPPQASNAPAPIIVTLLERARRPVEQAHLPAQPVLSPSGVVTRSC